MEKGNATIFFTFLKVSNNRYYYCCLEHSPLDRTNFYEKFKALILFMGIWYEIHKLSLVVFQYPTNLIESCLNRSLAFIIIVMIQKIFPSPLGSK